MGKAARNKVKRQGKFYKNPKTETEENPMSKELLYGVNITIGQLYLAG